MAENCRQFIISAGEALLNQKVSMRGGASAWHAQRVANYHSDVAQHHHRIHSNMQPLLLLTTSNPYNTLESGRITRIEAEQMPASLHPSRPDSIGERDCSHCTGIGRLLCDSTACGDNRATTERQGLIAHASGRSARVLSFSLSSVQKLLIAAWASV